MASLTPKQFDFKHAVETGTPAAVSILKKGLAKLDISPETVSFTLVDDASTLDVERRSFSVTPHPSKGWYFRTLLSRI
jgi:hypothetical protein